MAEQLGEHKGRPCVLVESRTEWRSWLRANHATSGSIWVVRWNKETGRPHLAYDDLVEEALCFGWIDSTINRYDDGRSALLVAPRKRGSTWSASNKERIARLDAAGLLEPAGRAVIERAKADGSWTLLDEIEAGVEPADLAAALDAAPAARASWNGFSPSVRKGIMAWVILAKRPETRAKRIETTVRMAAKGLRAQYDPEQRPSQVEPASAPT